MEKEKKKKQCRDECLLVIIILSFVKLHCPGISAGKESFCNAGDLGLIPGSERSSGVGLGYPLQYSWASLVSQSVKSSYVMQESPEFDPCVGKIP